MNWEDEQLKIRFMAGSHEALERIYRKYADWLLTIAMALLADANAAEDVLHDVFVKLARSTDGYRLRGNLRSFLATCVANRARDILRQRGIRETRSLDVMPEMTSKTDCPSVALISHERSWRMSQALSELSPEQREVVVLHVKAQMSYRQIAKRLGIPLRTVQGRYRYGLEKLRTLLTGEVES